jgi:hypothetical protein
MVACFNNQFPGLAPFNSGPEPEFFIFDEVRYEQNQHTGMYNIDSTEGSWNTARFEEPNLGYRPSYKGGYFPVSPTDTQQDIRTEMVEEMQKVGIVVEKHHHEVATGGQAEIDMLYAPLVQQADNLMWHKYIPSRRQALLRRLLTRLKRTISSCWKAMCLLKTLSRHGFSGSGKKSWMRWHCGRIHTNSIYTMMLRGVPAGLWFFARFSGRRKMAI